MIFSFKDALNEGIALWQAGGWAMIPLAINALILYGKAAEIRIALWSKNHRNRRWKDAGIALKDRETAEARAYFESRGISLKKNSTLPEVQAAFDELRAGEMAPLNRNLRFMKIAMSAAPLWGLLGTVTGMLVTFDGLARGGGGDKTMNLVAGGISEALITTQTGLMIALPGLFFHYYLSRQRDAYAAFLAHLESAYARHCMVIENGAEQPAASTQDYRHETRDDDRGYPFESEGAMAAS